MDVRKDHSSSKLSTLSKENDTEELDSSHLKTCFSNIWESYCYSCEICKGHLGQSRYWFSWGMAYSTIPRALCLAGRCKVQLKIKQVEYRSKENTQTSKCSKAKKIFSLVLLSLSRTQLLKSWSPLGWPLSMDENSVMHLPCSCSPSFVPLKMDLQSQKVWNSM